MPPYQKARAMHPDFDYSIVYWLVGHSYDDRLHFIPFAQLKAQLHQLLQKILRYTSYAMRNDMANTIHQAFIYKLSFAT